MVNKTIPIIIIFSLIACGLHAVMLHMPFNNYLISSIIKIIIFVLCPMIFFALNGKKHGFAEMFSKGDVKNIKRSFLLGFGVFSVILIIYTIISPYIDKEMIIDALENNGINSGNFPLVFIYIVLINALLEEIFFRGFVFMTLYRAGYKHCAYVYSSLLFAFYHVAILRGALTPWIFIFCIFGLAVAGLIFNELTVRCKNITGSLIVHISANLSLNLIVVYYLYLK
ncbi:MAG: CPBP family intramembrane metalloprotease [Oscillospiraceae bacterium]|nr:CPBP family intramembrane metalloprotease [Oscillospiraceae bacterium]